MTCGLTSIRFYDFYRSATFLKHIGVSFTYFSVHSNLFVEFLYKALCNIIKSTAEPIFAEYIGKFQIRSIHFDTLTLGTIPPAIHGK